MKKLIFILIIFMIPFNLLSEEVKKVGAILYAKPFYNSFLGLKDGLKDFGYEEGKNIVYYPETINTDLNKIEGILQKFSQEKVNIIFTTSTFVALKVKEYISLHKIPIIFNEVDDPVLSGVVDSLSKPNGCFTGVSHIASKLVPKRIEIFKSVFPQIKRIFVFYNSSTNYKNETIDKVESTAQNLNIEPIIIPIKDINDLTKKTSDISLSNESDALFWAPDAFMTANSDIYYSLADKFKVPMMVLDNIFIEKGGCVGYSPDFYEVGKQSAHIANLIFSGAQPANIPVEYPEKIFLVINLKEIKRLGLEKYLNKDYLHFADKIIK